MELDVVRMLARDQPHFVTSQLAMHLLRTPLRRLAFLVQAALLVDHSQAAHSAVAEAAHSFLVAADPCAAIPTPAAHSEEEMPSVVDAVVSSHRPPVSLGLDVVERLARVVEDAVA
jgi:hypothetical protein